MCQYAIVENRQSRHLMSDFLLLFNHSQPVPSYLRYEWRPVPVAGDVHNKRPVVGVHEDAGGLGTGGVECRGTTAVGALHAAAVHLPLHPLPAVHTLLRAGGQRHDNRGQRGKCK